MGGRTTTLSAGGFRFDLGPTFFLYPQVLESIFEAIGRDLWQEVELIRLDPQYSLIFGAGGQLHATPDIERMEQAIAEICPADSAAFRRFLAENRAKLEEFKPCLERPFLGWRDVFSKRLLKLLPTLRPWLSLDQELARYFSDPRIRMAFSFQSKYLGMSPYRCPSLFSILSFLEYEHGVYHPIGGCGAITECMARIAREMGVEILLGEEVQEIVFEGRRAVGVRTAAGTYAADALVINADFARAMTRLVPDNLRRRWTDRRIARKRFSCSTFMLYLGIEGRYDDLPHHTIYLDGDYVRNLREIEDDHVLSGSPSFYVQNACVTDSSLAPPGMSTLYVLVPVTHQHGNVDWTRERRALPRARAGAPVESRHQRPGAADSFRARDHAGRLGTALRDLPRSDIQPRPQSVADAAPPATQPVRGPGTRLPRRRWHPSRERFAGHLRIRPHHLQAPGGRPGIIGTLLEARAKRIKASVARGNQVTFYTSRTI